MESEQAEMKRSNSYQNAIRGAVGGVVLVALVAFLFQQRAEPLEQRVAAFWEARIQGDDAAAYQYEIYAHTGKMTLTQYIRARSPTITYQDYEIDAIRKQENEALVKVKTQFQLTVPGLFDRQAGTVIKERWVRLDDARWYRNVPHTRPGRAARSQS